MGRWMVAMALAVGATPGWALGAVEGWMAMACVAGGAEIGTVPNGSFEQDEGGKPADWTTKKWKGEGAFEWADVGHKSAHSVSIASESGGDLSWMVSFEVKPYSTYRFRGWIKTKDVKPENGMGAVLVADAGGLVKGKPVTGTKGWTETELTVETGGSDCMIASCTLGGWGRASGTAWFDDLSLELVSSQTMKPSAVIDASKPGAPISKYIYGQFIEHLGHCIYGGIWAEMLEDRKFFYNVGAKESPWHVWPEGAQVSMAADKAYTGAHAVAATGAAGIEQRGLAFRNGKEYVGRVVLAGDASSSPVEVALLWGTGASQGHVVTVADLTPDYKTTEFHFTAAGDTDDGALRIAGLGTGTFYIGTVSLMPADNVQGMRADTLALLKELDAPVYRWPGGNFVSGYNWRDGIGDRDRRPPRKNPAWKGVEHNDFGLDEFMVFCRMLNTEPYMTVNSGLGVTKDAVEELEYANAGPDTPMGKLRASNGHAEPYGVRWWSVGNEMYGNWQLGHMPLEEYVKKHNEFADAMRAVDPSIKLVAVGATGNWSKTMLAQCADHMDLLSEHFYCQSIPGVLSHSRQMPDNVKAKADAQRQYYKEIPALANKHIPIALDEWNYWYGPDLYGEIGTRYFQRDALGIAAGLHEYARQSDLFEMANYAQTVNVIGAIKTSKTAAAFDTTGLVLMLYRRHFGTIPVAVSGDVAPLDVAAAWREDRKALTVAIVNATRDACTLDTRIDSAGPFSGGRRWLIASDDPWAYNEPGKDPRVKIVESPVESFAGNLEAPALSVALYELKLQ